MTTPVILFKHPALKVFKNHVEIRVFLSKKSYPIANIKNVAVNRSIIGMSKIRLVLNDGTTSDFVTLITSEALKCEKEIIKLVYEYVKTHNPSASLQEYEYILESTVSEQPEKPVLNKLAPCRVCEKEIATEAKTCPHCGIDKPGATGELDIALQNGAEGFQTIIRIAAGILFVILFVKCTQS